MKFILFNHTESKAVASFDDECNTLRYKEGNKTVQVTVNRSTTLSGQCGTAWFAITQTINYGSSPFLNGDNIIQPPSSSQLEQWLPKLASKANALGSIYLEGKDALLLHSVWAMN